MKFCGICQRAMMRNTSTGSVVFKCLCGNEEKGNAEDARLAGKTSATDDVTKVYSRFIAASAHDPAANRVMLDCPDCGLDYQSLVRVGAAETVIIRCKCGRQSTPSK